MIRFKKPGQQNLKNRLLVHNIIDFNEIAFETCHLSGTIINLPHKIKALCGFIVDDFVFLTNLATAQKDNTMVTL